MYVFFILLFRSFPATLHLTTEGELHTCSNQGCSKAAPKHQWTSTMFDCRGHVLFFEGLISFSENRIMRCFTKKLNFSLICPQDILPEGFWLPQERFVSMSAAGSCWVSYHGVSFHSDGNRHCCTLRLQVSLNWFGSWSRFFIHYWYDIWTIFHNFFSIIHVRED